MRTLALAIIIGLGVAGAADPLPAPTYTYHGTVLSVYDGDTLTADVDLGFDVHYKARLRLEGVDAPEVTGGERMQGQAARDHVRSLIEGKAVVIISKKREKYGRWLASIVFLLDGKPTDLSAHLIANELAKEYKP